MENTLTALEINCTTGEEILRPFTKEEIAAHNEMSAEIAKKKAEQEAEAQAKAELKASALAKLAELGLTEDEAKAIAG
jgi:hypothetical protein